MDEGSQMDRAQQQIRGGTSNGEQTPATPVPAPVKLAESCCIPPLELSANASPLTTKPSAVARLLPGFDSDPGRTPTPAIHPGAEVEGAGVNESDHLVPICFTPQSTLRGSSSSQIASMASTSNTSSPLQSGHASSTSFQSSWPDSSFTDGIGEPNLRLLEDPSFAASSVSHTSSNAAADPTSSTTSTTCRQPSSHLRREGPHYPNQSFAALQPHYCPPPYEPHPLRTRSSHPSQNSFYSSPPSTKPRNLPSMASGSKTAGNTPAQSPGLFTTASSSSRYTGEEGQDVQYTTAMLHSTHLQAPKE